MIVASKEGFENWLKKNNFAQFTAAGNLSTTHQYTYWVERVMEQEGYKGYSSFAEDIQEIIRKYGDDGPMKKFGDKGHKTVINALQRFFNYLLDDCGFVLKPRIFFK